MINGFGARPARPAASRVEVAASVLVSKPESVVPPAHVGGMSVAGRFAVGVAVVPVDAAPPSVWEPADPEPWPVGTLAQMLPPRRSAADHVALLGQITTAEAMLAGLRAQVVTEFAALRPDSLDRPAGRPGAAAPGDEVGPGAPDGVSESSPTSWRWC
jgi:hypothetical protein